MRGDTGRCGALSLVPSDRFLRAQGLALTLTLALALALALTLTLTGR